jgi:hypothetical protein
VVVQWLAVALAAVGIVVPVVTAVVADGMRTRTRIAVMEARTTDNTRDIEELSRRVARHERDPVHAMMRGGRR